MTQTEHIEARTTLAAGGTYTLVVGPFKMRLYYVAGGAFLRLDVRDVNGALFVERSGNYQFSGDAFRDAIAFVGWARKSIEVAA